MCHTTIVPHIQDEDHPLCYHLTPADETALFAGLRAGQDTETVLTARYPAMAGHAWAVTGDRRLLVAGPLPRALSADEQDDLQDALLGVSEMPIPLFLAALATSAPEGAVR